MENDYTKMDLYDIIMSFVTDKEKERLELFYGINTKKKTIPEIAKTMGISENCTERCLSRAKRRIKNGIDSLPELTQLKAVSDAAIKMTRLEKDGHLFSKKVSDEPIVRILQCWCKELLIWEHELKHPWLIYHAGQIKCRLLAVESAVRDINEPIPIKELSSKIKVRADFIEDTMNAKNGMVFPNAFRQIDYYLTHNDYIASIPELASYLGETQEKTILWVKMMNEYVIVNGSICFPKNLVAYENLYTNKRKITFVPYNLTIALFIFLLTEKDKTMEETISVLKCILDIEDDDIDRIINKRKYLFDKITINNETYIKVCDKNFHVNQLANNILKLLLDIGEAKDSYEIISLLKEKNTNKKLLIIPDTIEEALQRLMDEEKIVATGSVKSPKYGINLF